MTGIAILLAGSFIAAGLLVAYSLAKVASDADDWAQLHDIDWNNDPWEDWGDDDD